MNIQVFESSEFGSLPVSEIEGRVYFRANNVAEQLGYANPAKAIIDHCKGVTKLGAPSNGGTQMTKFIPEGDVYRLIVKAADQSKNETIKAKAERYEHWVFDEVLPSVHNHGGYMAVKPEETPEQTMARALLMADDTIKRQSAEIIELRPKALLAEAVVEPSPVAYTVTEATRYLANIAPGVRRQDVFDILRATGMMCKGSTAPTRAGIDTGRMVALAGEYRDKDTGEMRAGRQRGKITCKGLAFLTEHVAGKVA